MRKRYWLGLAVSLLLVYLLARSVELASVGKAFREADFAYLLPALVLYFGGVLVRAARWGFLLRSVQRLSLRRLFMVLSVGFMANDVLPLRAGEAARAYLLWRKERLDPTATVATIVVERILDGIVLTGFLVTGGLLVGMASWLVQLAWMAGGIFVVGMAVLLGLAVVPKRLLALVDFILVLFPPRVREVAARGLSGFAGGLGIVRDPHLALAALLMSVVAWALEAGMYYLLLFSFPLPRLYIAALLGTAVANLASMVPSSPGYVGTFDAGLLAVMVGTFGADQSVAAAYTTLVHAALVLPITSLGLLLLWREGLSLKGIASRRSPSHDGVEDCPEAIPRRTAS